MQRVHAIAVCTGWCGCGCEVCAAYDLVAATGQPGRPQGLQGARSGRGGGRRRVGVVRAAPAWRPPRRGLVVRGSGPPASLRRRQQPRSADPLASAPSRGCPGQSSTWRPAGRAGWPPRSAPGSCEACGRRGAGRRRCLGRRQAARPVDRRPALCWPPRQRAPPPLSARCRRPRRACTAHRPHLRAAEPPPPSVHRHRVGEPPCRTPCWPWRLARRAVAGPGLRRSCGGCVVAGLRRGDEARPPLLSVPARGGWAAPRRPPPARPIAHALPLLLRKSQG